jgi:hypothetical protein
MMIQTLTNNRLLLALCGVIQAMIAAIYLAMQAGGRTLTFLSWNGAVGLQGKLALAAGACAIAAGVLRSGSGKCWMLALHGLALGALGVIQFGFVRFPVSFLSVSLLIVVMAISMGALELEIGATLRRLHHAAGGWLLSLAGMASIGFAVGFIALGFGWIRIEPGSYTDLLWLGAFFGFNAICMLLLFVRLGSNAVPAGSAC